MSIGLYMDEHVPEAITLGLLQRGVDVVTPQEDERDGNLDQELLERATELRRIVFTQDHGFFALAARLQRLGHSFAGVFFMAQGKLSYRQCIDELELIAKLSDWADWQNQIHSIPLES